MLLSTLLPTLVTLLSLAATAVDAHSLRAPAPHRRAVDSLERRGFSAGAPHYSLYLYDGLNSGNWPTPDKIQPFNRALLAFWTTTGAQGASSVWAGLSDSQRQSILDAYHNAGIAVLVSAFGDSDLVITNKNDPVKTAQDLAAFTKQYNLDGVDIDFEDFTPLQNDQDNALNWLTQFHTELRTQLPSQLISSTPTAWIYGNMFGSQNSVYCRLQQAVGDKIDWYNMQLYNGYDGTWDTCEHTFWNASNKGFLSVQEISNECGIPMSKITVGKLWDPAQLAHDTPAQIPAPADLGACLAQVKAQIGYPQTGIMIWAAEMNNWNGAIDYLKGTLAAMDAGNANPPAVNAAASPSSAIDASTSPSNAASAAGSAPAGASAAATVAGATTDGTGANGTVASPPSVSGAVSVSVDSNAASSTTVSGAPSGSSAAPAGPSAAAVSGTASPSGAAAVASNASVAASGTAVVAAGTGSTAAAIASAGNAAAASGTGNTGSAASNQGNGARGLAASFGVVAVALAAAVLA